MYKCYFCGEKLEIKPYRGDYNTIVECKCGALNSIYGDSTDE